MANEKEAEELTSRISYEIIKDVAPKELPFFDDFKEKFLKDPEAFTEKNPQKKERILGFGLPAGTTQILTTFVLPIVSDTIKTYLAKKFEKTPSKDQINEMRTQAYNNAIALGMKKEKAELIADALVGKMMRTL